VVPVAGGWRKGHNVSIVHVLWVLGCWLFFMLLSLL
jgi:hypothetical protein